MQSQWQGQPTRPDHGEAEHHAAKRWKCNHPECPDAPHAETGLGKVVDAKGEGGGGDGRARAAGGNELAEAVTTEDQLFARHEQERDG